jgi:putative ABC transport system permease protein
LTVAKQDDLPGNYGKRKKLKMNLGKTLLEALDSLMANKLRSGLTILGIVIGVAAVIAMLALGQGAEDSITGSIEEIGTNLLFVTSGANDVSNPKPLTRADADALTDPLDAPSVLDVTVEVRSSGEVTYSGEGLTTSITGVDSSYSSIRNLPVGEGEFINDQHLLGNSSVVVIGTQVAKDLFDRKDGVVGESIRIDGQPFRVIGVLEEKGGTGMGGEDSSVLVPLSTARARLATDGRSNEVDVITVQAISGESVADAEAEVSQILANRHRTEVGVEDFSVISQNAILDTFSSITGVITVLLGGIGGISLLVGGIGIMNIMLVSVTERTREIGLRKALGARKMDILIQFLTESAVLSLIGGFIGILLGWGISQAVAVISAASEIPLDPAITLDSVLLATLFSAAVGVFFGIYPANRASSLVPVEALRYE